MTSHDVVSRVRRLAHTRKVGHGGTLDPMATGVLVIGIGKATKLLTWVSGHSKEYRATIRFGVATNTDDAEGAPCAVQGCVFLTEADVEAVLAPLRGDIMQVPTTVSAIKVGGKRAYALARAGEDVELAARPVRISRLEVLSPPRCGEYVVDEAGVDLELLKQVKEVERGRVADYVERRPGARLVTGGSVWDVPGDVALPCATQNELPLSGVQALIKNGVQLVAEGANMPTTPEAIEALQAAGVAYAPGKASNAGGVATSGLEMQQNSGRTQWAFEETDAKLHQIMVDIHANTVATAEEYGVAGDYVAGANLAGFRKVADAMVAMGLI